MINEEEIDSMSFRRLSEVEQGEQGLEHSYK